MTQRARILQEPLLHFLVIGAALFAAYAWLDRGGGAGPPQVRVADSDVRWLVETFVTERQRQPTAEELRGLVRGFVKEALLARQAQELGLDKDDIVVRRRLAQKMSFLLQDDAPAAAPNDDDLRRLYAAQGSQARTGQGENGARTLFTRPRISFAQIFFSRDQRADAAADARQALRDLSRPDGNAPAPTGDRVAIKAEFRNVDERAVANQLGAKFAAAVFGLAPGPWQGPIESSQGIHLVHITELLPARLRPFDEVKDQLVDMWREQSQRENEERDFVALLKKYQVAPDDGVKALVGAALDAQGTVPLGGAP
jgi:PPIC-type PPIASE domain